MSASPEAAYIARLLIVRLGSMGDIIHTLPAVATLRRAFPGATIGWAVERRWTALLSSAAALAGPRSPEKPRFAAGCGFQARIFQAKRQSRPAWKERRHIDPAG